jgi:hypothetical protein
VNGNCPKHLRNASLTACSALVLALAGCGGDDSRPDNAPRIDPAAASELASISDDVARLIDEGNTCDAAHRADDLFNEAQADVESGTVPPELAAHLLETAEALRNELSCEEPPPPPPPAEDEDEEGNGRGKGNGKKKDGED